MMMKRSSLKVSVTRTTTTTQSVTLCPIRVKEAVGKTKSRELDVCMSALILNKEMRNSCSLNQALIQTIM